MTPANQEYYIWRTPNTLTGKLVEGRLFMDTLDPDATSRRRWLEIHYYWQGQNGKVVLLVCEGCQLFWRPKMGVAWSSWASHKSDGESSDESCVIAASRVCLNQPGSSSSQPSIQDGFVHN